MSSNKFMLIVTCITLVLCICSVGGASDQYTNIELEKSSGIVRGDAIPGGELDYLLSINQNRTTTLTLVWDGCDSAPDKLDHSGLGGMDFNQTCRIAQDSPLLTQSVQIWNDQGTSVSASDLANVGSIRIAYACSSTLFDRDSLLDLAVNLFVNKSRVSVGSRVVLDVDLIVKEGDTPAGGGGNAVTSLNNPFTNGNGQVGFTGAVDDLGSSDHFVWYDTDIVWLNSSATSEVLTGAEATMGISDQADFVYSPAVGGLDSVYTNNGALLTKGDQAPGHPVGTNNTFNSRPTMLPNGTAVWIAGFDDTGGTSTKGRIVYKVTDLTTPDYTILIQSDDLIGGIAVDRPSGVGFDYMVSDYNDHYIQEILLDTGSTSDDGIVYADGVVLARETEPAPISDNWDNFDRMVISSSGDYAFSGDTDGDTGSDEFICYNGTLIIREGDTIAGVELVSGSSVNVMSINNNNHLLHQWSVNGVDTLFLTCDPDNPDTTTHLVMTTGDQVDINGDTIADGTITDLNASGSTSFGYSIADDGYLFAEVDLDLGSGEIEAIIKLELPECGPGPCPNHGDVTLDGVLTAGDAQLAFLITLGSYSPTYEEECAADCNGNGTVTAGDAQQIFLAVLGTGSCVDPI